MRFNFQAFLSWIFCGFGICILLIGLSAACAEQNYSLFLWCVPGIVVMAAGFAMID